MTKKSIAIVCNILRPVIGVSAITLLTVLAGVEVRAAEWRIEPALRVAAEFDDNADLSIFTDEEQDISGYVADVSARFAYTSPVTSFFATPRFVSRNYGEEDFDSDDQFLRANFRRDFRSSMFGIGFNYGRELARTGERADAADLEVEDPDDIPVDDSGRVFIRGRRERIEVAPRYSFSLSEKSSLGIGVRHTDTSYDEELSGILNDYTDTSSNLTYRRAWSSRNTAIVMGTYREYESDCPTCFDKSTGYGLSFGYESRLSETTTLSAVVGAENTELESGIEEVNPIVNVSLSRRMKTINLFAQYRRVISGGGGGSLASRDIINLNFRRQLNDRMTAGLGVRAYSTNALKEGPVTFDERDYVQLRALFIWKLNETVSFDVEYRYTIINRERLGESANSNNVLLWLSWRPIPIVRSR